MSLLELIGIASAMGIAAFVQSISGFGLALLSVPLMSLFADVRLSVVVVNLIGLLTTSAQAWKEKEHADASLAVRVTIAAIAGMPLGLLAFIYLSETYLKVGLGIVVLFVTLLLMRGFTLQSASRSADWLLGGASGALSTSVGTNGPPLVFLFQARQMPQEIFRATISRVFIFSNVVTVTIFAAAGKITQQSILAAVVSLPVLVIAIMLGFRTRRFVNQQRFRVLVLSLLVISGISTIVSAVLS
jgi:uncharacterized membrane protein YfcA